MIQETVGERSKSVAVIRLSLCEPLGHQVVQVRADECFYAPVAQRSGDTAQHLKRKRGQAKSCHPGRLLNHSKSVCMLD